MRALVCVPLSSHSDFGGFVESGDPVDEILLVVGLQEELPHPGVDDCVARTDRAEELSGNSLKGKCGVTHPIHWAERESSLGTKYSATCATQLVLN